MPLSFADEPLSQAERHRALHGAPPRDQPWQPPGPDSRRGRGRRGRHARQLL